MAGRITELTAITGANVGFADLAELVDVSDTSMAATGTNKKITLQELGLFVNSFSANYIITTYSATSVTANLSDAQGYIRFTGTNPTYTIPPNATVAFNSGTQINGIGVTTAMTLIAGAGVTINKARTLVTVGAKSGWTAVKIGTNEWDVHGDFV